MDKESIFELEFQVRDYECDLQGIVNNAVYLNYMEHTRHEFLKSTGLDFSRLHSKKVDTVVAKMEIAYKQPLKSDDKFVCRLNVKKDRIKYVFHQKIYLLPNLELCTVAKVDTVCIVNGRLAESDEINDAFARFL